MLKKNILSELECGKTVSGQEMAEKYGVSRNAVWKAVNALKREGYEIACANKAGYTLLGKDVISPSRIQADAENYAANFLPNTRSDVPEIICLGTVDSTNNEAKRRAASLNGNALIVASSQTAGRGRFGRSFYSPDKTGAYFSLALHGERDFTDAVKFTTVAAVAVCRAIENLTKKTPLIKWVNEVSDIESGKTSCVIIGIGINLTTENFPAEVQIAGALNAKGLTRSGIIAATVCEILKEVPYIAQKRHIAYYRAHSFLTGKEIVYYAYGEERYGVAVGIDDDGGLIVKSSDGQTVTLAGGEVSVRVKPRLAARK